MFLTKPLFSAQRALFVLCVGVLLSACQKEAQQVLLEGQTMGTTYHVKYIERDGKTDSSALQKEIDALLADVNRQMSTYQPDSEISRFNQSPDAAKPFHISPDFAKVVHEAVRLNKVTEGALDVTVGPLVNLFGFGPDKRLTKSPTPAQIAERSAYVGIDKLSVDANDNLQKAHSKLYLDLSSIAKGFGVDKVAELLEAKGMQDYLVEIGGEMRGRGNNLQGEAWRIAIEKPEYQGGQSSQIVIPLHNFAIATSGDYRNYYTDEQGNRLSHIIDPKTKKPVAHNLASITVIAPSSMTADGLSTGLFVQGSKKALAIAEKEKLPIFLILKNGEKFETKMSSAFAKLLKEAESKK